MDFRKILDALNELFGVKEAVKILFEHDPKIATGVCQSFWEFLTLFTLTQSVFRGDESLKSGPQDELLEKLLGIADTYPKWRALYLLNSIPDIYVRVGKKGDIQFKHMGKKEKYYEAIDAETLIVEKIKQSTTFENIYPMAEKISDYNESGRKARVQLYQLITNIKQLILLIDTGVTCCFPEGLDDFAHLEAGFAEWSQLYLQDHFTESGRMLIVCQMLMTAQEPENWQRLFGKESSFKNPWRKFISQKFAEILYCQSTMDAPGKRNYAEEMFKTAKTPIELWLAAKFSPRTDWRAQARAKIIPAVWEQLKDK